MDEKNLNKDTVLGQAALAKYTEQAVPDYKGNPLIEALPDIFSEEELFDVLSSYPLYDEDERKLPPHIRYHCVMRITRYFQPRLKHFDLESRLSTAIRQGYIARNPLGKNYAMLLQQGYQMIKNKKYPEIFNPEVLTSASGFTMIGISGIGKTKAIEHVLAPYPKLIVHSEYNGQPLNLYQIPWLKLDCPHDGSLKALCINFFTKIDELLGTNYYEKFGTSRGVSTDILIPRMAQLASLHCIGVLIIDEIQHLSLPKSGGAEKMLNFFVSLVNTIGIPVVLVGTYKARPILQAAFRQARRGSGQQGDLTWDILDNDEEWDILIDGMMRYQWTKEIIPLSKELKNTLYEESQGIVDIAIKLFIMGQLKAISTGIEKVSSELIRKIAKENLRLVKPMLEALKSGNTLEIAKYDDIRPTDIDLQRFFENNSPLAQWDAIKSLKMNQEKQKLGEQRSAKEQALMQLLQLEVDEDLALIALEKVLSSSKNEMSVSEIVKASLKLIMDIQEKKSEQSDAKKVKPKVTLEKVKPEEPTLCIIVDKGRENKKSAYEPTVR
ncbi:ATP-binding protein [Desulfosporosinus sp. BICA1-9]|uniref:ATP-binding protein n=1 Tax=Desulfosporosinus sp. BICA1-9 TaxID=1531958 RepID=UPI0005F19274|nr:ATP-binding protein [Desulfosporosinus sp. BICA1-9]KJS47284.1 MAG: hypothetical protein VR66_20600 [Peptococcaceae bacterium BRH_c23]KJS87462.1 MAG: hypothetical protein JL57_14005 [Desulfosporosinus sp. BICA1-9]HBW35898.1 ATP-binding protein [Desulfosporosinus sp.]